MAKSNGQNLPVQRQTSLGWILTRTLNIGEHKTQHSVCNLVNHVSNYDLNEMLSNFGNSKSYL